MFHAEVDHDLERLHQFRGWFCGTLTDSFESFRQHYEIYGSDGSQQRIPILEVLIGSIMRDSGGMPDRAQRNGVLAAGIKQRGRSKNQFLVRRYRS